MPARVRLLALLGVALACLVALAPRAFPPARTPPADPAAAPAPEPPADAKRVEEAPPPRPVAPGRPIPAEVIHHLGATGFRHHARLVTYCFSPDSRTMFSCDRDSVSGWDLATGNLKFRTTHDLAKSDYWWDLFYTRDAIRAFLSVEGKLWAVNLDPETGHELNRVWVPSGGLSSCADPPPKEPFTTDRGQGWVNIRDAATGRRVSSVFLGGGGAGEFTPDGRMFLGCAEPYRVIHPYDPRTGQPTEPAPIRFANPGWLSYGPSNRLSWVAHRQVYSFDSSTGRMLFRGNSLDPTRRVHSYGFAVASPDGSSAVCTGWGPYPNYIDPVHWIDPRTGELGPLMSEQTGHVYDVVFTRDSSRVFYAHADDVQEWDVATRRKVERTRRSVGPTYRLSISPGGTRLAAMSNSTAPAPDEPPGWSYRVWDLKNADRKPLTVPFNVGAPAVMGFAGDDRFLAAECGPTGRLTADLWDVSSGQKVRRVQFLDAADKPDGGYYTAYSLSPDGRTVAAPAGADLVLLEAATGRLRHSFRWDSTAENTAFSWDGKQLASGSAEGGVVLWDVRGELSRPPTPPDDAAIDRAWAALTGDDAKAAFGALRLLAACPDQAVPLLARKVPPAKVDHEHVDALFVALDGADAQARERAARELEPLARVVEPAMREVAKSAKTAAAREALNAILVRLPGGLSAAEVLAVRAVEVAEWIGTPEAVKLLETWAAGAPGAVLTEDAKAAVARRK